MNFVSGWVKSDIDVSTVEAKSELVEAKSEFHNLKVFFLSISKLFIRRQKLGFLLAPPKSTSVFIIRRNLIMI